MGIHFYYAPGLHIGKILVHKLSPGGGNNKWLGVIGSRPLQWGIISSRPPLIGGHRFIPLFS